MINLFLDRHDFLFAVEGFARGSHLRQHVWGEIVIATASNPNPSTARLRMQTSAGRKC